MVQCCTNTDCLSQVPTRNCQDLTQRWDGRQGPGLCHHQQEQTQNSDQVGQQEACGGAATLSMFNQYMWYVP